MRRIAALLLLLISAACFGQAKFTTQRFDAEFVIQPEGNVVVTEVISINFRERQRGLIRKLPFRTRSPKGDVRTVAYSLQDVQANQGGGYQSVETRTSDEGGDYQIRIGSQNVFLTGPVTYVIRYTVRGALTPIDKADDLGPRVEFLWNLLPTDWPTEIPASTVHVRYPTPKPGKLVTRVLAGDKGTRQGIQLQYQGPSQGRSDQIDVSFVSQTDIQVRLKRPLRSGQTVTADVALPGDTVVAPPPLIARSDGPGPGLNDLLPRVPEAPPYVGLIPLLPALLVYFLAKRKWPAAKRPLVVRFDPPDGIGPSLSGTIIDGRVNPRDIVAGIVSLAQKGAIKLHHAEGTSSNITIELLGLEKGKDVLGMEQVLYNSLAEYGTVLTSEELRGNFGAQYQVLTALLYREGKDRHIFAESASAKGGLGCLLVFLVGVSLFGLCLFQPIFSLIGAVIALVVGFVAIARISDVTPLGQQVRRDLEGLQEFITRANERELNYMADKMPDQALFERLLPYAIAFDAVKQWTQAFRGIDIQMPDWYEAPMGSDSMWTYMLMNDLDNFGNDYGDAMSYTPPVTSFDSGGDFSSGDSGFGGSWSDSGGGFDGGFSSGGGGGGGGGDSW
jgi:uncharacterized membrane protein YgcG